MRGGVPENGALCKKKSCFHERLEVEVNYPKLFFSHFLVLFFIWKIVVFHEGAIIPRFRVDILIYIFVFLWQFGINLEEMEQDFTVMDTLISQTWSTLTNAKTFWKIGNFQAKLFGKERDPPKLKWGRPLRKSSFEFGGVK